jgi:uncharacterized protein (DUF305 family)
MNYRLLSVAALIALAVTALPVQKYIAYSATSAVGRSVSPEFVASTDKTFDQLMTEAMSAMHRAMHRPEYTGDPDHDFVSMMIPHHQGAIDMAKAVLLYGRDPQLRRLAQEIITDQQSEIQLMQLWLKHHGTGSQAQH